MNSDRFTKEELTSFKRINGIKALTDKLNEALLSDNAFDLLFELDRCGWLGYCIPEIEDLKGVETHNGLSHKDIFLHTLKVVQNLQSYGNTDLSLSWAALLHDIGKPATKRFTNGQGWTFSGHEVIGADMAVVILDRLELGDQVDIRKVRKLVRLHMRPRTLVDDTVTDSGVRRLLTEAGQYIEDLLLLSKADITSNHIEKINLLNANLLLVKTKLETIKHKDELKAFNNPINGNHIMYVLGIEPSNTITILKDAVRDAILAGEIEHTFEAADKYMRRYAEFKLGIKPVR
jgi:putative nucleotidyltransferase with HDIG domain